MPTFEEEVHSSPYQSHEPDLGGRLALGAALEHAHYVSGLEQTYALDQQGNILYVWPSPQGGGSGGPGPPGPQGPAGSAGQGFSYRGAWAPNTAYTPYDVVTHGGQTYEASTSFTSGSTFNSSQWNLWVAKGADGAPGAPGSPGSPGSPGPQGPAGTGLEGDCIPFPKGAEICNDTETRLHFHMDTAGTDAVHQMDPTGYQLPAGHRLEQATVVSSLPDPTTAPTVSAVTTTPATTLPAGSYNVVFAYNNDWGSTNISPPATVTISAGQGISASCPPLPAGATSVSYWFV